MNNLNPDIFIHAAELVESKEVRFACIALAIAVEHESIDNEYTYFFHKLYRLEGWAEHSPYFSSDVMSSEEAQTQHRVIALCLAAAVVEAGGLTDQSPHDI